MDNIESMFPLSARYNDHPFFFMTDLFIEEYAKFATPVVEKRQACQDVSR